MSRRLAEILEEKQKQHEKSAIDLESVRDEWISNCEKLMKQITEWLRPFENYLEIQEETISIREEQLGDYEAPALRLVFVKSQVVAVKPVGRFILGAEGRVDLTSGSVLLAMLIHRGNDVWEFARREGKHGMPSTWPFNRETFEDLLAEFLEV